MILRLIALLFASAALVMGLVLGWAWPLGSVIARVNPGLLTAVHSGAERFLWQAAWDSLMVPVLAMPAWTAPAVIALALFFTSALRPGRG